MRSFAMRITAAVAASILGGVLTLALLALRQVPLPAFLVKQPWFARLSDPTAGVPYGVALALAALYIADELFRAREELSAFEGDLPKRIGAMVDLLEAIVPAKDRS